MPDELAQILAARVPSAMGTPTPADELAMALAAQERAQRRAIPERFPMEPTLNAALAQMGVGALPFAGEAMDLREAMGASSRAGERLRAGDIGGAGSAGVDALTATLATMLPGVPAIGGIIRRSARDVGADDAEKAIRDAFKTTREWEPGAGQNVAFLFKDGEMVSERLPSHGSLLAKGGLDADDAAFQQVTGALRLHGPTNIEMHQRPTSRQLSMIRRLARQEGESTVTIDAIPGGDFNKIKSEVLLLSEIEDFVNDVFGASNS